MGKLKVIFAMCAILLSGTSALAGLYQYTCGNYIYQVSTFPGGKEASTSLHDRDNSVQLGVQLHRMRMGNDNKNNVDFLKVVRLENKNGKLTLEINGFENICENVGSFR